MSNVNPTTDNSNQLTTSTVPQGILVGIDPPAPLVTVTEPIITQPQQFFTAEDIAKARAQEKSKLYPELEKYKSDLEALQVKFGAREAEEQRLLAEKAESDRKTKEAEMDVKDLLAQKEVEWNQRFAQLEEDRRFAEASAVKEREFSDLMQYKTQRLAEESENIIPHLLDFASGNTKDEIDASIASLVLKSNAMLEDVQAAQQNVRREMPGTRVTAPSPTETNTGPNRQFSSEEIQKMSITEYAKYRANILSPQGQGISQGLFGSSR